MDVIVGMLVLREQEEKHLQGQRGQGNSPRAGKHQEYGCRKQDQRDSPGSRNLKPEIGGLVLSPERVLVQVYLEHVSNTASALAGPNELQDGVQVGDKEKKDVRKAEQET